MDWVSWEEDAYLGQEWRPDVSHTAGIRTFSPLSRILKIKNGLLYTLLSAHHISSHPQSTCIPRVPLWSGPSSELRLPRPPSRQRVSPIPHEPKGEGTHSPAVGGGRVQIPTTGEKAKYSVYSVFSSLRCLLYLVSCCVFICFYLP
jgi:hypothetical protein